MLAEDAICYSTSSTLRAKYSLLYYMKLVKHRIVELNDMAGPLKPAAAALAVQGAEGRDAPSDPLPHP
ncbi:hypothetical protein [Bradyrhizobium sp. 187]|jgi:pyruvate carboxylase|uniref:hypothetical protein n=1 Tax=Bradyrhizobium sp. 187 TaxID=2782655 RepID=UPI00206B4819|nr:hypothetical protein IVB19_30615 [Bradyrhizobium sp. 187]